MACNLPLGVDTEPECQLRSVAAESRVPYNPFFR